MRGGAEAVHYATLACCTVAEAEAEAEAEAVTVADAETVAVAEAVAGRWGNSLVSCGKCCFPTRETTDIHFSCWAILATI